MKYLVKDINAPRDLNVAEFKYDNDAVKFVKAHRPAHKYIVLIRNNHGLKYYYSNDYYYKKIKRIINNI